MGFRGQQDHVGRVPHGTLVVFGLYFIFYWVVSTTFITFKGYLPIRHHHAKGLGRVRGRAKLVIFRVVK